MAPSPSKQQRPSAALCVIARRLAHAIDRAQQCGQHDQVRRLARAGRALASHSLRLADRLARLHLAQGRYDDALAIIDAHRTPNASLRLIRAACLLQSGRTAEAHLDLHQWSRSSTAPLAARRLLGLLEWRSDDANAASAALTQNLHHADDPQTLEALVAMSVAHERPEQARQWAQRLRSSARINAGSVDVDLLCDSLGIARADASAKPRPVHVEILAAEITADSSSLLELVRFQEQAMQGDVIALLSDATRTAYPQLAGPAERAIASEALARLAVLQGRHELAVQWARRALEHNPMSASMSLLAQRLQGDRKTAPVSEPASRRDVIGIVEPNPDASPKRRAA